MSKNLPEREYILHIDSGKCTKVNGKSNHIIFYFPLIGGPDYHIDIELLSASIPYSFFNISDYYRYLSVRETQTSNPANSFTFDISIPAGNYNINQLINQLQTTLNANTQLAVNYIISYDKITNKLTFSTPTTDRTITFLFNTGNKSKVDLQKILGFDLQDYSFSTGNNLISVGSVNISPYSNIFIVSPNLSITNQISSLSGNYTNILHKIPINTSPNTFIYDRNLLFTKYRSGINTLNAIELLLTDEDLDLIDFNGVDWYCSIKVILTPKNSIPLLELLRDELIPVQVSDE
jgi:hypothetical protein